MDVAWLLDALRRNAALPDELASGEEITKTYHRATKLGFGYEQITHHSKALGDVVLQRG